MLAAGRASRSPPPVGRRRNGPSPRRGNGAREKKKASSKPVQFAVDGWGCSAVLRNPVKVEPVLPGPILGAFPFTFQW